MSAAQALRAAEANRFVACRLMPEGWVVLSPWITTPEGYEFRLHIVTPGSSGSGGYRDEAQLFCEHVARQLNEVRS